jgi:hypothetical protein
VLQVRICGQQLQEGADSAAGWPLEVVCEGMVWSVVRKGRADVMM